MQQIEKVAQLANTGRLGRLLHNPVRYLSTQVFLKYIYPKTRKGRLRTAQTFFGREMEVLLPAATDIYLTGGKTHDSEIRLARFMAGRLKDGDVYIDIGAHFGYYTLLAATLVGEKGKVYAFEAAGKTYEVLKRNAAGVQQVTAYHNAVSDKEEHISFYEFPILYSEYNSIDVEQFSGEEWMKVYQPEKTEVKAVTLDGLGFLEKADFIKIDVEGAEDKVLKGAIQTLQAKHPVVIMEYISNSPNAAVYDNAFRIMNEYNYKAHLIEKDGGLKEMKAVQAYFLTNNVSENIVFT